ncbi:hypothetical protein CRM22_000557 [Opisthorchis felineus]|uniref:Deoxyribodipyrimidine photo-lyase n=1 Tax=Opisthorchis felineus TaxID=147828 RepID=A0A4S2MEI3_OPIFE|nr:hypothetical protein CRM22_000557 [Opisthorchis felineus]
MTYFSVATVSFQNNLLVDWNNLSLHKSGDFALSLSTRLVTSFWSQQRLGFYNTECLRNMSVGQRNPNQASGRDFLDWLDRIARQRQSTGSSVAEFKFAKCRVRQLSGPNLFPDVAETGKGGPCEGGVLYWMNRDQRVQDNWAFLYAQRLALKFEVPLHACFCVVPRFQAATLRHFKFLVDGLAEVEKECCALQIPFHLVLVDSASSKIPSGNKRSYAAVEESDNFYEGPVAETVVNLVQRLRIGCVVTDFCPLREPSAWVERTSRLLPDTIPFCQVDAHNVVPLWFASDKLEYAARTIRRKLHEKATGLLTEFPVLTTHPYPTKSLAQSVNWEDLKTRFDVDHSVKPVDWAKGGTRTGLQTLFDFITKRLKAYATQRNDPTKDALSDLSPWFHFGHIAPQRALLEVQRVRTKDPKSADAFIEEAFIRRELSDNFCFYNPNYDSLKGAYQWAQDTLKCHSKDKRDPAYTSKQLEAAQTKDDLWNASQRQLVRRGKIHGFLRMYWAKKILEWHAEGPEAALRLALYLNDHYSLDGTDPNGVVGVMWSICGVHDQGWAERPIFGKIRCMTYKGCQGKFCIPAFVVRYP